MTGTSTLLLQCYFTYSMKLAVSELEFFYILFSSVLGDLRGSVVKYLVAHGVDEKKAEEAVLKIHGRPTR